MSVLFAVPSLTMPTVVFIEYVCVCGNYYIGSMQRQQRSAKEMDKKKLFKQNRAYNLIQLKTHLQDEGVLDEESMHEMILTFTNCIKNEPNFMNITGSTTIVGDIHGQYYDFLKVLTKVGDIEEKLNSNILFLGDYVDRGANSVEVMTFIMALKINYPKKVFLLRGNHESRCMTNSYNFMKETVTKYNQSIYERFMCAFDALPLACLINKSFFCVHGGISDKMMEMEKINEINRFQEIPLEGPFCDFIWADPVQIQNGHLPEVSKFNESRQCSIYFGKELTKRFVEENNVKTIIRAHEVFPEGYQKYCWGAKNGSDFPTVVTVFSAPNYCGVYGNKGAIIRIEDTNFQIKQYKEESINNKLHSYLQVFQWSVPEISRVINDFTKSMMSSIFELYLRDEFPKFKSATPEMRLQVLLNYIKKQTNIEKNLSIQNRTSKEEGQEDEEKLKERMFNRSRDYFRGSHKRPDHL